MLLNCLPSLVEGEVDGLLVVFYLNKILWFLLSPSMMGVVALVVGLILALRRRACAICF